MKTLRQTKILEIIRDHPVETQSELLDFLRSEGFAVTQATVSRDIKEMRLVKLLDSDGKYKYSSEAIPDIENQSNKYLFSTAVVFVEYTHTLVVIKTRSGMAQAVCAALDSTYRIGVIGSIAGDDTIFVATRTDAAAANLVSDLRKMISGKES